MFGRASKIPLAKLGTTLMDASGERALFRNEIGAQASPVTKSPGPGGISLNEICPSFRKHPHPSAFLAYHPTTPHLTHQKMIHSSPWPTTTLPDCSVYDLGASRAPSCRESSTSPAKDVFPSPAVWSNPNNVPDQEIAITDGPTGRTITYVLRLGHFW